MNILLVSPAYNEEKNITEFIKNFLNFNSDHKLSLILVDDGSTDRTWSEIQSATNNVSNIFSIKLIKNYGKDIAIKSAIDICPIDYDAVITLDSDLQHPFEKIHELISHYNNDLVDCIRLNQSSFFRGIASFIYNRINKYFGHSHSTDFRIFSAKLSQIIKSHNTINININGLFNELKISRQKIFYTADKRYYGRSSFNFYRLFALALKNLIFYTPITYVFPLFIIILNPTISYVLYKIFNFFNLEHFSFLKIFVFTSVININFLFLI